MPYDVKAIGRRLWAIRTGRPEDEYYKKAEKKGKPIHSLQTVADHCEVKQYQTVSAWESGNITPSLENLIKLCGLFNCELGYFLGDHEGKTRAATDIHEYTSLSYEVIERLHNSKEVASILNLLFDSVDENRRCLIDLIGEYLKFNVKQDAYISENGDLFPLERNSISSLERTLNPGFYLDRDAFTELYLSEIRDWLKHIREIEERKLK